MHLKQQFCGIYTIECESAFFPDSYTSCKEDLSIIRHLAVTMQCVKSLVFIHTVEHDERFN